MSSYANYNSLSSTSTGRISVLFLNNNIIIQGIDYIKFSVDDNTFITDINNNIINFFDLKLNTIVAITPTLSSLDTASSIVIIPDHMESAMRSFTGTEFDSFRKKGCF
jgi:hypothetical protein